MTSFKEHEKFFAFMLLGIALFALAVMLYIKPLPDTGTNSGVLQILNMIIGAFIGAFGAAAGTLFNAKVTVDNKPSEPIPTTATAEPAPVNADGSDAAPSTPPADIGYPSEEVKP